MIKNIKLCLPMLIALWPAVFLTGTVYGNESEKTQENARTNGAVEEQVEADAGGEDEMAALSDADQEPAAEAAEEQDAQRQDAETQQDAAPHPLRNPFDFSRENVPPSDAESETGEEKPTAVTDALNHRDGRGVPSGIRLSGLLLPKVQRPMAALHLPGRDAPVFVVEGDIVVIDAGQGGSEGRESAATVIVVHSITQRGVELAPKARPEDKVIVK